MCQWLLPPYLVQSDAGHAELQSRADAPASNASLTSMLLTTQPQAQLSGVVFMWLSCASSFFRKVITNVVAEILIVRGASGLL